MHILHMHHMHIFSLNRTAIPVEINVQNLSLLHEASVFVYVCVGGPEFDWGK